jgi:hypothetical protein
MIFGTIVVSMTGTALPVLTGVWLMPRSISPPVGTSPRSVGGQWLLLRRSRRCLEWLSTAVRQCHLPGSNRPASTVHHE